ncbi:MAG: hypothetical protein IJH80_04435 [Ruminococcus sp.]|nr:hypothetical protein [Ruminococcus sp.]
MKLPPLRAFPPRATARIASISISFTTTTKPAESAADQTSAAAASSTGESSSSTGNNIVLIIIGVVGGLVLAGVLVFILLGRKSKEAYNVNRHRFIKK